MSDVLYKDNEIIYLNFLYNELITSMREAGGLNLQRDDQEFTVDKESMLEIAREIV